MPDPRLRPLSPDEVDGAVREEFERFLRERGNIPNMFRTVARRPGHMLTMLAHFRTVMNEGTVPLLLKELVALRVSHLNQCHY
jgi:alkylhydroperoxidase family enzyme